MGDDGDTARGRAFGGPVAQGFDDAGGADEG
jgi:hypothetical protein